MVFPDDDFNFAAHRFDVVFAAGNIAKTVFDSAFFIFIF